MVAPETISESFTPVLEDHSGTKCLLPKLFL
jgi:hypothetical protein